MVESGSAIASPNDRSVPLGTVLMNDYEFEEPAAEDAVAIAELIAACPPLDPNSLYCNLLQSTHFARTCVKAVRCGVLDGWVSGYRLPDDPEAMFVWQVAVHERARGIGLGKSMLDALFKRPALAGARRLITTVTPSNEASRAMFAAFARQREAAIETRPCFDSERHFAGHHESEELIIIGPF